MQRIRAGASRGDFLHNAMEEYVLRQPVSEVPKIYHHLVQALVNLADEHLTEVYAVEHMMVSKFLGLGGTCDLIGLWDNKKSIIDWKGSTNVPWDESLEKYRKQGRIYGVMAKECHDMDIEQIVIAGVKENGEIFLHAHDAILP